MSGRPGADFLPADGEMAALIRDKDWSQTPLGPIETWSPSLRMMIGFMLANRFPLLLWWGPEYTSIYNDAYGPVLGAKHPWALGRPVRECWSEIADVLQPLIDRPFSGGPATWSEDLELEINRHGFLEETHFTVAYSAVPDERAPRAIGGVLATVHEITDTIIGERRLAALHELGARSVAASAQQAGTDALGALARFGKDIPFALLYLRENEATARLCASAGVKAGDPIAPEVVSLEAPEDSASAWPLARAMDGNAIVVVENIAARFGHDSNAAVPGAPHTALVIPVQAGSAARVAGALVAAASPRIRLDDKYRDFLGLVAAQLGTSIANARAYEDERRRAEALAQIDHAKTAFFSNVSHEFRTPLTLMLGPLEDTLAGGALSRADHARLKLAHRNSLRLLKLVNSLLDFARVEAGRAEASYVPVDLAVVTCELAGNFRSACERAGLALVVDCPPLPQPVYVDRDMWEKIVLNLLSNAFKFTFEGAITVRLRAGATHAALTIADTGVGIPAGELPRLFERFHRIEGQRGRTFEGSGIGLALVQELAGLHGGTIRADSEQGRGTVFTIDIPFGVAHLPPGRIGAKVQPDSAPVHAEVYVQEALRWLPDDVAGSPAAGTIAEDIAHPRAAAQPEDRPRPKVLVADDNADMRAYVRGLLQDHWEVRAVGDGVAALAALREATPDIVIADAMMPVLDGFGLLRAIRNESAWHDVPVIMLSARAGEESRIEGLEAGADDYLVKPFSARELVVRVTMHLELASARLRDKRKLESRRGILELVAGGAPLGKTLDALMLTLEAHEPGMRCGILIVGDDGRHFRRGSGPRLPEAYHRALDGAPIGAPWLGACGEAADCCAHVKVPDVAADTRHSQQWRELLLACGIHACRSTPVCGRDGRVLASITMYYDRTRDPDPADPDVIDMATHLAAIAIEHEATIAALREQEQRQALLIHELNHRVKNTLAVVQALAVQTLRGINGMDDVRDALDARLISLSRAHDLLTVESWQGGDLAATVRAALETWSNGEEASRRFNISGQALRLRPKALLALSMAVHELATNAVKWGALSNDTGAVEIRWDFDRASGEFRFCWMEVGGPEVKPPLRRGFGSRLIERGLAADVTGEVRLAFPAAGLTFALTAPLSEIEGAPAPA